MRHLARSLAAVVLPDDCRLCQLPLEEITRAPVCSQCWSSIEPLPQDNLCPACAQVYDSGPGGAGSPCPRCAVDPPAYDRCWAYGTYEGRLRRLIHLFKFEGMAPLSRPLARLAMRQFSGWDRFDAIVPVPLHPRRQLLRGFNQSLLVAQELGRASGIPVWRKALRRVRETAPQAGLSDAERRVNVRGAFRVLQREDVQGKRFLVVDDVMTTGATLGACAAALKRAGAQSVTAFALARAERLYRVQ